MRAGRPGLALALWGLGACGALLFAGDWHPGVPFRSADEVRLEAAQWRSPTSELQVEEDGRRLSGQSDDGYQLVWVGEATVDVDAFRYLHVCASETGPEQRLVVLASIAGRLQRLPAPPAWGDWAAVDLREAGDTVSALAVAFLPVDYLPRAAVPDRQPVLCGAELRRDNLRSRLEVLWGRWFGPRGWVGRSINSAGLEHGVERPADYLPYWAGLSVLGVLLGAWAGVGRRGRWALAVVILLVPALAEWRQLAARAHASRVAAVGAAASGQALSAMPTWDGEMQSVRAAVGSGSDVRVLVVANNSFAREYPVWLLRGFDVGGAQPEWLGDFSGLRAEGAALVVPLDEGWSYRPESGVVQYGSLSLPADALFQGERWLAVRLRIPEAH